MKKFYLMMFAVLFAALGMSAKTYTGPVYLRFGTSYTSWEDEVHKIPQTFEIEGNNVVIKNFLNSTFDFSITYDLTEGTITSNFPSNGWVATNYNIDGSDYTGIYSYGDSYFYASEEDDLGIILEGYVMPYDTEYHYGYWCVYLSDLKEEGASAEEGTVNATAYTYVPQTSTKGEEFELPVIVKGSQVTLPNFLGSGQTYTANIFESNPVFSNLPISWTAGEYTVDGATYTKFKDQGHKTDKFAESEDGQWLSFNLAFTSDEGSAYKYLYIELPEEAYVTPVPAIDWTAVEAKTVKGRTVSADADKDVTYDVEAKFAEGAVYVPNFLGSKQDIEVAYNSDNEVIGITSIYGSFWDGGQYGIYTESSDIIRFLYPYGDETQSNEMYFNAAASEVTDSYVKVNATVTYYTFNGNEVDWNAGYTTRNEDFYIYFAESTGISNISVSNSNAAVEYYNLNGVRVNGDNLTSGLYIRRQGNQATKVLVK
jgi:hypothetical protein